MSSHEKNLKLYEIGMVESVEFFKSAFYLWDSSQTDGLFLES